MNPVQRGGSTASARMSRLLLAVVLVAALGNALAYTLWVANPVVTEDAWYFLDVFVSKDLAGELSWTDYFVKRAVSDHSQPLHKLVLALNTRWFGLDFMLEAVIGVVGMLLCCLILLGVGWHEARRHRGPDAGDIALLGLIPLLSFSLNSNEIYTWPLVTLIHLALPFALLLFAIGYRHSPTRTWWGLPLSAFAAMIALDGAGLLASLALLVALVLDGFRGAGWRSAWRRAVPVLIAVAIYRLAYTGLLPPVDEIENSGLVGNVNQLIPRMGEAWNWVTVPATASLVHLDHLVVWFDTQAAYATILIGVAVMLLHALFWRSHLRTPSGSRSSFVAACLMLFVYATVAGIVLGRVPHFGSGYLWQHRYIAFFQLANVALVLQWLAARAHARDADTLPHTWRIVPPLLVLALVTGLQVALSVRAWEMGTYYRLYYAGMADTIHCLAEHPHLAEPVCEPVQGVCKWRPKVRTRLVNLLRENRLNVFSPAFLQRHGISPDALGSDRCVPAS